MEYIPKGSMCLNCQRQFKFCGHFNFRDMKTVKKLDSENTQVICSEFQKKGK